MSLEKQTFKAGTIELEADDNHMRAQETRDPPRFADQVWGYVIALIFFAAACFFWFMPVENSEEVFWLRVLLCGGFVAISLVLIIHALIQKSTFEFVEVDRRRNLLISGRDTKDGREITNQMALSAIENIYLGSEAINAAGKTLEGTQTLYVFGEGAPKKNILMTGTGTALNEIKAHVQRLSGASR